MRSWILGVGGVAAGILAGYVLWAMPAQATRVAHAEALRELTQLREEKGTLTAQLEEARPYVVMGKLRRGEFTVVDDAGNKVE